MLVIAVDAAEMEAAQPRRVAGTSTCSGYTYQNDEIRTWHIPYCTDLAHSLPPYGMCFTACRREAHGRTPPR